MAWRLPRVMVPVLSSSRVSTSPAASTARPDMASTLCWTSRSMPAMPMADSRAPMVVGIRQTSRAISTTTSARCAGVDGERLEGHDRDQEDDGEPAEQDREGDLVGRLLPLGPLDEGDHPVEEALAGLGGDPHHDPVGQHPGPAGDGRAVAAGLADDRGRLAGDGRLVDRGDALDDLAVAGDDLAGLDRHLVARPQSRRPARPRSLPSARSRRAVVSRRVLRSASAWALPRPSAIASAKLANSTVNHSHSATWPVNEIPPGPPPLTRFDARTAG